MLRTIGSGGMGVVYLVVDTRRSNQIMALKMMSTVENEHAIESFRSEFKTIRGVVHPHIPEVYDFGTLPETEQGYYFTTEFVDGKPLDQLLPVWSPDQLRSALVSLCRALAFLHSRSLLHRDIKPDNVLARLNPNGEFAVIKLVDFGLAASAGSMLDDDEAAGTLDYMAPELFSDQPATISTDLYALGVLMYKLAVGRLPFADDDAIAAAKQRGKREAPHPLRFRPDLPVGLADVIAALVQSDPEERPQSARHTIALLNERDGTNFEYESAETRSSYISSSGSVTNTEARHILSELRDDLKAGKMPRNVLIRARAGLGRTRMLKEFAVELTLAGLKSRIVSHMRDIPPKSQCPDVILVPDAEGLPIERIDGLRDAPTCQQCWWIAAGPYADGVPEKYSSWLQLELHPLDEQGVASFLRSTFPDNIFPDDFVSRMLGHTLGYPSSLEAALEELVRTEKLRIGLFGWELLPGRWNMPVHRHVVDVVRDFQNALPDCIRTFLNLLACSPGAVPEDAAREAIARKRKSDSSDSCMTQIFGLGWIKHGPEGVELNREAVKTLLLGRLSREERRAAHRMLYDLWLKVEDVPEETRAEALLYHDFIAGEFRTSPSEAGELLEAALLRGRTAWVHKLIEESKADLPATHRNIILVTLSRVEYIEGDIAAAAQSLGEVVKQGEITVSPNNLIYLARYAALIERLGQSERAEFILKRCLAILSDSCREAAGSIYGTLSWIAFKRGDGEEARKLAEQGLVKVPPNSDDAGFALLLNTVATLAFYRGDTDVARTYWQRCLEVFEASGDRKGVANMYNNLGVLAAQAGDRLRARTLWERCADISKEIDDVHRLAGIYNNLGIDSLETGSLRQAEEFYLKSLSLFRKMENPREQVEILSNLGELAYHRADYPRALAYLNEAVKLSETIGDQESQLEPMIYLGNLLLALESLDHSEEVLNDAQKLSAALGTRKSEGQAWEGLACLYSRREEHEHALEAAERASRLLSDEADPLALLNLHLTYCQIAADGGQPDKAKWHLDAARKVADTKWDPYSAARTLLAATLYAGEHLEGSDWQTALRKVSVYPYLEWRFHWATARQLAENGQLKRALDEYGRGITILKSIAARLPEDRQNIYLKAPLIARFKEEVVALRSAMKGNE
ncbi:MAG: protein kinase [Calditrichaeota bacterium]|nr:protein kinase [Calditrichota bacterium]